VFRLLWRSPLLVGTAALLYLLLPGHHAAWATGLPLSTVWLGVLVALLAALATLGRTNRLWGPLALVIALLCVVKVGGWSVASEPGLVARYYTFDEGQPLARPERSTDFLWLRGATRIDPDLRISGEGFPLHFFNNNQRWNSYKPSDPRHDDLPFLVLWDGYLAVPQDGDYHFILESEGPSSLALNATEVLRAQGRQAEASATLPLRAGLVPIHVQYERIETGGRRLKVTWNNGQGVRGELGPPYLFAFPPSPLSQRLEAPAAFVGRAADALFVVALAVLLVALLRLHVRAVLAEHRGWSVLFPLLERPALALVVLFAFGHALTLTQELSGVVDYLAGGEDPLTRETQAREIALEGPLMTFGDPLGKGKPYYSQILYPYLLTLTHRVVGEPLGGVYVVQLTLLGVLVVLVYLLGKQLSGVPVGLLAAALFGALVWREYIQVALTLFAEDFYTPLTVAAVLALVLAIRDPSRGRLLAAAPLLALAALTRFTGMAFVPIVVLLFWLELRQRGYTPRRRVGALATLLSVLLVGLALVSARNMVVASTPNVIPASLGNNLVKLHQPSDEVDLTATKNPIYTTIGLDKSIREVLEFARQDLDGYLSSVAEQALYAIGYTDLVGGSGVPEEDRPYHLGFFGGSLLYLVALLVAPRARSREALLLHGFILSHWLLMGVFFASQYRYRLILPMYPFIYVFAALALWRLVELAASVRARAPSQTARIAPPRTHAGELGTPR
jgi:hypothetical protein